MSASGGGPAPGSAPGKAEDVVEGWRKKVGLFALEDE
jgi:hypothetical protein